MESSWIDTKDAHLGVIFSKKEVFIHPTPHPKDRIPGFFSLVDLNDALSLHWTPNTMLEEGEEEEKVITVQPKQDDRPTMRREDSGRTNVDGPPEVAEKYAIKVPVSQIRSIKKHIPSIGYSFLVVTTNDGVTHPPFYFHSGGLKEFWNVFNGFVFLSKSPNDPNLFLANDTSTKLSQTLTKLNISQGTHDSEPSTPTAADRAPAQQSIQKPPQPQFSGAFSFLDPFAKVTQFARDVTAGILFDLEPNEESKASEERKRLLKDYQLLRRSSSQNIRKPSSPLDRAQQTSTNLGTFEVLSSTKSQPIEESARIPPLSKEKWEGFFDEEGRITDIDSLRRDIFLGGVTEEIRPTVWKFLLGFYPLDSDHKEREMIVPQRREQYQLIKNQWALLLPEQEQYFSKLRKRKHQIEKDVNRTDRGNPLFRDDNSPHLKKLYDILLSYTFYNFDLGYVQGMNDLLSPILCVIEDEAEAFWCYVGLMDTMRHNFDKDQHGMHKLLLNLRKIIQVIDPELYRYLERNDLLNLFFCFRWLLVSFKREFPPQQVMLLWEALWACPLTPNFHLFVCIAILEQHKAHLIRSNMQFDDILKYVNDLAMNIDLESCLKEAEILFYKFKNQAHTPDLRALVL